MKTGTVTVIGAVELELTECRAIFNKLARRAGKEAAERVFFADLDAITAEHMLLLAQGGTMELGKRLKSLALAIFAIELLTENEVTYHER